MQNMHDTLVCARSLKHWSGPVAAWLIELASKQQVRWTAVNGDILPLICWSMNSTGGQLLHTVLHF